MIVSLISILSPDFSPVNITDQRAGTLVISLTKEQ